jgi:L-alanine-DL-glutamate epimerase-like enolase superfamily enzyme
MAHMLLSWEKFTLKLRNPFRLSYGTSEERQAFWIRLVDDQGWGESTIPPYYSIQTDQMEAYWGNKAECVSPFPDHPHLISAWVGTDGPAPARCGLDLALHDRIGRREDLPLYKLLGLPFPNRKSSAFTISVDTPTEMAKIAAKTQDFPILKIKLGCDSIDMDRLIAIRKARPNVRLWVDANAGWKLDEACAYLDDLEKLNVELLEQPLDKEDIEGMGSLQSRSHIPIVADESLQNPDDIKRVANVGVQAVNIKLMKVGGISPALMMISDARRYGLKVMLGCMIETSIGTTAMAHLASLADWLDLDASLLITNDPFDGMRLDDHNVIQLPKRTGIGIVKQPA